MTADLVQRLRAFAKSVDGALWGDTPGDANLLREAADRLAAAEAERDEARLIGGSDANMYLRQKLAAAERVIEAARRAFTSLSELNLSVPMRVVGSLIELRDALAAFDGSEKAYLGVPRPNDVTDAPADKSEQSAPAAPNADESKPVAYFADRNCCQGYRTSTTHSGECRGPTDLNFSDRGKEGE